MTQVFNQVSYGLTQPLITQNPVPVIALRAPTVADVGHALGTLWIEPKNTSSVAQNLAWVLTSVINNKANWLALVGGGGAGSFASLVVTPGPISLTGTTAINTTGAAVTTIGTGGTGAVNIGNATGNVAVTGTLTSTVGLTAGTSVVAGTGITATTGNITALTGNVISTLAGVIGVAVAATGDLGGTAAETTLTNVSVPVAGGTGAFTITSATTSGAATNAGFIKMYVGTTAVFVPYYTTTA